MFKGIRFPGLARSSSGTGDKVIKDLTGYIALRDGDDWVVPANDPQLLQGPSPLIHTDQRPIPLSAQSYASIAKHVVNNYLTEFEKWQDQRPPANVPLNVSFGLRSELARNDYKFFFEKQANLELALTTEILPFMHDSMKATKVSLVKIRVRQQYGILALAKISYLTKQFGFNEAADLVLKKGAMTSVLPFATDVLGYLQGLLNFSPLAVTFPLKRLGCELHFFNSGGCWSFPREVTVGIFELARIQTPPMTELRTRPFIKLNDRTSPHYFSSAIGAVNHLTAYMNDPRHFIDGNGEFDLHLFLKTQSAAHLLFADLASLNHTTSPYLQMKTAFSFIDKLANLIANWTKKTGGEDALFKSLFSSGVGKALGKILDRHVGREDCALGILMKQVAKDTYGGLHAHLAKSLPPGSSELLRLERLRVFRNMSHGTFLRHNQFEEVFVRSAATVPEQVAHVPLLFAWCLALEPESVLKLQ